MRSFRVSRSRPATKNIPPALDRVRLASISDAVHIMPLCTEAMKNTFRLFNVEDLEYLIENSVFSLTQLNVKGDIAGFLSLREYPLLPAVDPSAWEEYIWTKYKTIELNARNTMWIHLVCWQRAYSREVLDSLLKSVYMHDLYLQYVCMIKTVLNFPQLVPGSSRAEAVFRRVQVVERAMPGDQLPVLLISERKEMCPRLRVRRAVEEDNDDIVPIIERHSERLRQLYGDFYISELIARHPESDRVLLVCEHKELAVGIMCINTQINFESLEECFELSPFGGLRVLVEAPHKHKSMDDSYSYASELYVESTADSGYNLDILSTAAGGLSSDTMRGTQIKDKQPSEQKVQWVGSGSKHQEGEYNDRMLYKVEDGKLIGHMSMLEYLDLFIDEDEDLEFDIVNITPDLLRVPYLESTNNLITKNVLNGIAKEEEDLDPLLDRMPKKDKKKSSSMSKAPEYIIRYSGASNAFLLELCAMHHDYDERYAFDMLEAAFEIFPERDYCVMSLPSNHPPFPLLEHFTLATPHSTRMRFINESLYVAHVNSVKGDVGVRPGELADVDCLEDLLEHAAKREIIISLFEQALKSRVLNTFMLLSQKQPIGVVIMGPLEDGVAIRTQYELDPEPIWPLSDGTIIGASMSPAFEPHARWFMRELMRQTRYCSLFWISQPFAKGEMCPIRNMMSLTERMLPVRPRGTLPNISGSKLVDRLFKDMSTPFALWTVNRSTMRYPKVNVNNSIVVVGASRTGLAFIEHLILSESSKYLTFTNITLVSDHGLPAVVECFKAADTAIPREGRYTDRYLKCMPFSFYVDVIPSVLVEIDRKRKCIYMANGGLKCYDNLVITCGQQFQHPDYLKKSLERVKEVRKGKPCERMLMDNPEYQPDRVPPAPPIPENLFLINSLLQANVVFRKLLLMMSENRQNLTENNRVVVFGDCLEAYCCIAALLELGLSGHEIAFIENYPPEDFSALRVNCFNDEVIDERVQERMEELGIKCYRRCRITKLDIHFKRVQYIKLMDPLHSIKVDCFALFYYGLRAIDINAFKAINECGLVYDGGLVVGPMFETNDPQIFGAGSCCNYSRRLYAAHNNHKYYNAEEVGEALGEIFLHRFDPFIRCHPSYNALDLLPQYSSGLYSRSHASIANVTSSREHLTVQPLGRGWQPVMKFKSAIVKAATLPGPLYYMKARQPGPDIPMEVQLQVPHQGHTLITDKNDNYFRLRLNALHCVDAVTCLSKEPFSAELFAKLYGNHEAVFNKLLLRYQMGLIDDLYVYFIQPWMSAIYQETFSELMENIDKHEVGHLLEKMKSEYAMLGVFGDARSSRSSKVSIRSSGETVKSTCMSVSECQVPEEKQPQRRKLRETITNYATRTSVQLERARGPSDIPTECGQSAAIRDEVGAFWEAIGGERIVQSNIGKYVEKFAVPNPQYAPPDPQVYREQ